MVAVSADQFMQLQPTAWIKMAEKIKINTTKDNMDKLCHNLSY